MDYKTRVYFSDTDAEKIAYHARYLDWAEHARTEVLRSLGYSNKILLELGFGFVVHSIAINYEKPAFLDDEIAVSTKVEKMSSFSMVIIQDVMRGKERLAHLSIKLAFLDVKNNKITKAPKEVEEALKTLLID